MHISLKRLIPQACEHVATGNVIIGIEGARVMSCLVLREEAQDLTNGESGTSKVPLGVQSVLLQVLL